MMATLTGSEQKVCKICFNYSSHKAKPKLTPESEATIDPKTNKLKTCSQCHQEWISIKVCKDPGTSKWVHVRDNLQKNVVLCRYIRGGKICPNGQSCTYAHNQAEVTRYSTTHGPNELSSKLTSQSYRSHSTVHVNRNPPVLSFRVKEYKICKYIQSNRRCVIGEYCTFAHSQSELHKWNQSLISDRDASNVRDSGGLVNTIRRSESETLDFASKLRSALVSIYRQGVKILGMLDTYEKVTIKELQKTLVRREGDQDIYEWIFEISVATAQTLSSVVLFDTLSFDFQINSIILESNDGKQKSVMDESANRFEHRLNQKIDPSEKILVKITLKTHPGILSQLVLFEFQSTFHYFFMVRRMSIYIPSDLEKRLSAVTHKKKAIQDLDLHWELHYKEIPMGADLFSEVTDAQLEEYAIPENLVNSPIKDEGGLTKENYRERMHHLLYLEEHEHKKIMSRYDLYDVKIKPESSYEEQLQSGMSYAQKGHYYVTLSLEEELFEGTNSIRSGDSARILISSKNEVHHCVVEHVGREQVVLHITERTKIACSDNGNCCSVRFVPSRLPMQTMHYAIDHVDLDKIFPTGDSTSTALSNPTAIKKCQKELKKLKLNHLQEKVISTIINPELTGIPTLVLGPFGVGKTHTLCDCIKLITWNFPDSHILVCTHSNSAANLYVSDIHSEWAKRENSSESLSMLRLFFTKRRIPTIRPPLVLNYCKMENGKLVIPTLDEIQKYSIVVTTLVTSRTLSLLGLQPGHFSHIIIDEAAQAVEPETIIPLCLADKETKIVLAGDHLQLMPPLYSSFAKQHDFHVTLLERLYDRDVYDSNNESLSQCRTLLTINYRSRQEILEIPSRLFYKTELVSNMPSLKKNKGMHAVSFVGVNGQECRDQDSPSYYNDQEATEVCKQVKLLVKSGLKHEDICTLAYDHMQVIRLRRFLRREKYSLVKVYRVDDVQGEEFRALIISTVRTCTKEPSPEEDGGFLTDPRLLNTAITRAREWLVIIGEPVTLCTVGSNRVCWMEFIKYCCQCKSFEYPPIDSEQFETSLENKLVLRNLLEEKYENPMEEMISHDKESPSKQSAKQLPELRDKVNVVGKRSSFNASISPQKINVKEASEEDKKLIPVSNEKQPDKGQKQRLNMKPAVRDLKTINANTNATVSAWSQPPQRSWNALQQNSIPSQPSRVPPHGTNPIIKTTAALGHEIQQQHWSRPHQSNMQQPSLSSSPSILGPFPMPRQPSPRKQEPSDYSYCDVPATRFQPAQLNRNTRATGPILFGSAGSHLSAGAQPFIPGQMRPMKPILAHSYHLHHNVHDTNPASRGNISSQMSATTSVPSRRMQIKPQGPQVLNKYDIAHVDYNRTMASLYGRHQPAPGPIQRESQLYSNPSPPRFNALQETYLHQLQASPSDQSSTVGSVSDIDSSCTDTEENLSDSDEESIMKIVDVLVYTEDLIGKGAFGYVFKGMLNNRQCAVKVLNAIGTELMTNLPTGRAVQSNALEKFKMECDHLEKFHHKNIVSHLATRTLKRKKVEIPVLVMELLHCNLRKYLSDNQPQIKHFVQVSLSMDVASALEFLHHEDRKVVHRDLCGDNILLSLEGPFPVAKVSDFGMSRIIDFETMSRSLTALGHRNGYLPREANRLSPSDSYDSSLDIFMFGAVMTQIATVTPHIESEKQRYELVDSVSPDHPLKDFIDSCLQEKGARPTAEAVRNKLSKRLQQCVK